MDFVRQFVENGYALLSTLGISVGSILLFLIQWLRTKAQSIKKEDLFREIAEARAQIQAESDARNAKQFEELRAIVVTKLESLENKVLGKVDANEAERKEEIRKQTLDLEATISAVQKKASIDEILSE